MFALSKFATVAAASQARFAAAAPLQARFLSQKKKTIALKTKEKSKLRRLRANKSDEPVQAKRNVRVSKL
ncbi:hypothetical protein FBU59_002489 [Linderina macrospora]|uniref:Uncharacterized protein n=1 Tax=Linderina macrospora TaxID=4868 RepID=A0ACC1JB59_9FUNG|nr:hypothetical protein FBU59_002489 [Linderina macrospora]